MFNQVPSKEAHGAKESVVRFCLCHGQYILTVKSFRVAVVVEEFLVDFEADFALYCD